MNMISLLIILITVHTVLILIAIFVAICISEIISMKWVYDSVIYFTSNGHSLHACDLQPYMGTITIDDFKANTKEWLIEKLHDMIISDAIKTIGNIHNELHKPQYPKTYEECCTYLGLQHCGLTIDLPLNYSPLFIRLAQLYICRNAYWKIAGEQIGLGKLWKPDFGNENEYKYGLFRLRNIIYKDATCINPTLLIFPTEEMRDTFYNNFKDLIEQCKELL